MNEVQAIIASLAKEAEGLHALVLMRALTSLKREAAQHNLSNKVEKSIYKKLDKLRADLSAFKKERQK